MKKKKFNPNEWLQENNVQTKKTAPVSYEYIPNDFPATLYEIERLEVDIAPDYSDWVNLGFALADSFGEFGRDYFHRISKFHSDYNYNVTDRQYSKCMAAKGNGVTIKTFFQLAKNAGIDLVGIARQRLQETQNLIVEIKDFTIKEQKQKKIEKEKPKKTPKEEREILSKIEKIENEYYKLLTNMYSPDELMQLLNEEYKIVFDKKLKIFDSQKREVFLNNILSKEELERQCCLKHVPLLEDVLNDRYSFNFTFEELQEWIIDFKPQTIFRGYYYDKTEHRFVSLYGNEYYCIENEIVERIRNLHASCMNIQKRDFKILRPQLVDIADKFLKILYMTKDVDYSDIRIGIYEKVLGERPPEEFTSQYIYNFFHEFYTCTDEDIDSLIVFVAATQRVHFFGDVKSYFCLLLTGDSGIGKDSFFPSLCCGLDYMSDDAKEVLYKGSLYGNTKFSSIDEKQANKLFYNWISDDIDAANAVNKLDTINNPYFRIERKSKNVSQLVKRFNTVITANFRDVIFGKQYDPNAIIGRFLFSHFEYRKDWKRSDYIEFFVLNQEKLKEFYKNFFSWVWYNIATIPDTLEKIKRTKILDQQKMVMSAIYKSEEDYQIYEIWQQYYNRHHSPYSDATIEFKGEEWVCIESIDTLRNIFSQLRYTPSAKKIAKTLSLFYKPENVLYQPQVKRLGQNTRITLMVKKRLNNEQ